MRQLNTLDKKFIKTTYWKLLFFKDFNYLSLFGGLLLGISFLISLFYTRNIENSSLYFFAFFIPPLVIDSIYSKKIRRRIALSFLKESVQGISNKALEKGRSFYFERNKCEYDTEILEKYDLVYLHKNGNFIPRFWLESLCLLVGGYIIEEYIDGRTAKL